MGSRATRGSWSSLLRPWPRRRAEARLLKLSHVFRHEGVHMPLSLAASDVELELVARGHGGGDG